MVAVANGYTDCALLLLSVGAKVDFFDVYHRTALHRAVSCTLYYFMCFVITLHCLL